MSQLKIFLVLFLAGILLTGCYVSDEEVAKLGKNSSESIQKKYGIYTKPGLQAYVDQLLKRLETRGPHQKDVHYSIRVLDTDEVNAFSIPPKYIFVTRGLLTAVKNEDELALVIGHEIGHIEGDDLRESLDTQQNGRCCTGCVGMTVLVAALAAGVDGAGSLAELSMNTSSIAMQITTMKFSRDQEFDADKYGVKFSAAAGYNPQKAVQFFDTLKNMEESSAYSGGWFSTHPPAPDRLAASLQTLAEVKRSGSYATGKFENIINGIQYGPKTDWGIYDADENAIIYKPLNIYWAGNSEWTAFSDPPWAGALTNKQESVRLYVTEVNPNLSVEAQVSAFAMELTNDRAYLVGETVFHDQPAWSYRYHVHTGELFPLAYAGMSILGFKKQGKICYIVHSFDKNILVSESDRFTKAVQGFSFVPSTRLKGYVNRYVRKYTVCAGDTYEQIIARLNPEAASKQKSILLAKTKALNEGRKLRQGIQIKVIASAI